MTGYDDLLAKLKQVSSLGFVKTHRSGDTGIGKTGEDLLGIKENNVPGPDHELLEIKFGRKNSQSMLTLFTKSPLPPKTNSVLLRKFGYASAKGNNRLELHTTIRGTGYNTLKGKPGFKIGFKEDRIELVSADGATVGYWDNKTLQKAFEKKFPGLLYIKADSKGRGKEEEFHYNEAWVLKGFDFSNFSKLFKAGVIALDIRIGQYPNGKPHDHGTGFRVNPNKLDECFDTRIQVL